MNLIQSALSFFQTPLKKQTSLLGEPPKEIRLSTNPYLNLASVLPGICLPGKHTSHAFHCKFPQPQHGKYESCLPGKSSAHSIYPQGINVVCLKTAKSFILMVKQGCISTAHRLLEALQLLVALINLGHKSQF